MYIIYAYNVDYNAFDYVCNYATQVINLKDIVDILIDYDWIDHKATEKDFTLFNSTNGDVYNIIDNTSGEIVARVKKKNLL